MTEYQTKNLKALKNRHWLISEHSTYSGVKWIAKHTLTDTKLQNESLNALIKACFIEDKKINI